MNTHLQQVGSDVSERLILKFDKQIQGLVADVDKFESDLNGWELGMQTEMSKNNQQINAFESEINHSLHEMSNSLNTKFKICQDFDNRVVERMDFLQESFRSQDLQQTSSVGFTVAQLEHDRQ